MEKLFGMSVLAVAVLLAATLGAQRNTAAAVVPATAARLAREAPLLALARQQPKEQRQSRAAGPFSCQVGSGFRPGVEHPVTR